MPNPIRIHSLAELRAAGGNLPDEVILDLSRSHLDDEAAKEISDFIKSLNCPPVLRVNLAHNNLTHKGAAVLADALTAVTDSEIHLNLEYNKIGDSGAEHFATLLATSNSLKALNLEHNSISSNGAIAIANGLMTNNSLQSLSLGTIVTSSASQARQVGSEFVKMLHSNHVLKALKVLSVDVDIDSLIESRLVRNYSASTTVSQSYTRAAVGIISGTRIGFFGNNDKQQTVTLMKEWLPLQWNYSKNGALETQFDGDGNNFVKSVNQVLTRINSGVRLSYEGVKGGVVTVNNLSNIEELRVLCQHSHEFESIVANTAASFTK